MNWSLLAVLIAIGLILSPVIALVPNARERKVARIRAKANGLGLRVRLAELKNRPKNNQIRGQLAIYSLPWDAAGRPIPAELKEWRLLRGELHHPIHFSGLWDWESSHKVAEPRWHKALKELLSSEAEDNLVQHIYGIDCTPEGCQLCWQEFGDEKEVERIGGFLKQLNDFALARTDKLTWLDHGSHLPERSAN